ncbi:conserved hypothetical protein [Leishmania major strain Friedlin]|uniref:Uncharacterized protein n=1 Tax=Leishmania major TaxID=5664 RepID=Q4QCX2_LEIMA|nr:conserved hypothetical protein [Leishmania major strain Friedlin]CAG9573144.1 hypothetical_protein_-_conserved [Leishmania major strain Friedlin]CAJ03817.1 conserved hypothetical protein [Leishmania major strain Friedlin]|eukprot:XP_001682826.1 conserved hypothetical protein [Leishmania major strain Friedlin]
MGGYPSHDAPNFLFATAAQHPNNGGTTEVCLVPLLRRHFNDTNRRLKDAVAQLYFDGPPNTTALALQAMQNGISSNCTTPDLSAQTSLHNISDTAGGVIPSAGPPPPALNATFASSGNLDASAETKRKAVHAYKAMDQLLNEIEASFFTATRVVYDSAGQANAKLHEKRMASIKGMDSATSPKVGPEVGGSVKGDLAAPRAIGSSSRASLSSQQSMTPPQPPMLRPVPCAVCTIEPDTSGRRGSSGQQNSTSPNGAKGNNTLTALNVPTPTTGPNGLQMSGSSGSVGSIPSSPEWVTVQGRRLRCIGYLSCFSKPRTVDHESKEVYGPESKPPLHVLRINECGSKGLDVAFELIFENEYKYMHLLEPVVFLASIMFRSQYLTSSMLQRPVHSPEVENAYYTHLQLLNIHVMLPKDRVHQLKVLQEQLPLLDFVEEMGLSERHLAASVGGEMASCGGGAPSLEKALTVGSISAEIITAATADGEAPTKTDSDTLVQTVVSDGGEVAKPQRQARGDDSEDREHSDVDDDGHRSGEAGAVTDVAAVEKAVKKREDGENEDGDAADSTRNTTADWEKDAKPSNASAPTASRRTRRSRRRQRKQKTAEPQDEIYRRTHCTMPEVSLYELSSGERGIEVIFDGALLARMMKLIAETAAYETVKNSFIRCDMGPLMKERRHLNQSRREALQEEGSLEREEHVMGSTIVAATVRHWVKEGLAAEEEKRKKAQAAAAHAEQAQHAATTQAAAAAAAQTHPLPPPQAAQMLHNLPAMHANIVQGVAPNALTGPAAPTTAGHPLLAAQAAAMGQNPTMLRMGMVPSNQSTAAAAPTTAATAGAPMLMYVAGVGYVQVPSNSRVLTAPAAPTQAAHPAYVINPATGQPMMVAPQAASAGATSASGTPPQPPQMMAFPSMMHMYNVPQQQQQMIGASQQYFAAQAAPQAVQQSQQQYQYMMGPGGQLLMVPVASAPTAQAVQQPQQQQPFMMTTIPPQQAPQMQPQQVYMNPYMMPGVMNMAAAQQQAQQQGQQAQQLAQQQAQQQAQYHAQQQAQQQAQHQAEGQKAYQQFMDAQEELQLLRQLQQQAQLAQQAPLNEQQQAQLLKQAQMMLQARRAQQAHAQQQQAQHQAQQMAQQQQAMASMAAGGSSQTFSPQSASRTPASTPPQQGSAAAPPASYNAVPGSVMPPLPHMQGMQHTSMQNMYAHAQQQQQQPAPTSNASGKEVSASGPAASAANTSAKSTATNAGAASAGVAEVIGDQVTTPAAANPHLKTNPYSFAAINDDEDDAAVALAAATAAMEAIRGHGGIDRDDDEDEDGSQFFSNGQFFFRAQ